MSTKPGLCIALSLGHNASAIGIADGKIIAAYEQERFTREKSSSKFAESAIAKIISLYEPDPEADNVFLVSHWYDDFNFMDEYHEKINKHFKYETVKYYMDKFNFKLVSLNDDFTHHDAHAYSATQFFFQHCTAEQYDKLMGENSFIFVFDGFGNKEEVASIYKIGLDDYNNVKITKLDRLYGYENSMGMMYQYATSYVGMKENEDEYKFLGYESRVVSNLDIHSARYIESEAREFADMWFNKFINYSNMPEIHELHATDGKYINVDYLGEVKATWHNRFDELIENISKKYGIHFNDVNMIRSAIGHYIQTIIETIHVKLVDYYKVDNIITSGGLYYNVKLNNTILKAIPGLICVGPLAGDQGAAIGLYAKHFGNFPYYDLTWGKRILSGEDLPITIPEELNECFSTNVEFINTQKNLVNKAFEYLKKNDVVQIVTGDMEFGPRALCNTSTLSIGYNDNVDLINSINGRNTVMPFAPVTIPEAAEELFDNDQLSRVVGSLGYMIITVDYKQEVMDNPEAYKLYRGVANPYPDKCAYSGRPQIVQDKNSYIYQLIDRLHKELGIGAIINTSLNIHGKPIVFTAQDAIDDLAFNVKTAKEKKIDPSRIHLLIYNEKQNQFTF